MEASVNIYCVSQMLYYDGNFLLPAITPFIYPIFFTRNTPPTTAVDQTTSKSPRLPQPLSKRKTRLSKLHFQAPSISKCTFSVVSCNFVITFFELNVEVTLPSSVAERLIWEMDYVSALVLSQLFQCQRNVQYGSSIPMHSLVPSAVLQVCVKSSLSYVLLFF